MLEEFMNSTGCNQRELADLLNVSPAYISSVLNGTKKLSSACVTKLNKIQHLKTTSTYIVIKDSDMDRIFNLIVTKSEQVNNDLYESLIDYFN